PGARIFVFFSNLKGFSSYRWESRRRGFPKSENAVIAKIDVGGSATICGFSIGFRSSVERSRPSRYSDFFVEWGPSQPRLSQGGKETPGSDGEKLLARV